MPRLAWGAPWLESLAADAIFGARQLFKHKTASAAAIVSLALGIGASMAAFRLIDALFLRPFPVAHPERLYELTYQSLFEGQISTYDGLNYPAFRQCAPEKSCRIDGHIGPAGVDVTFGSDQETERVLRQFVSGSMFPDFGLSRH